MTDYEVIGKFYPVVSAIDESIVAYKKITHAANISNLAGIMITLDQKLPSENYIFIPYSKITELVKDIK